MCVNSKKKTSTFLVAKILVAKFSVANFLVAKFLVANYLVARFSIAKFYSPVRFVNCVSCCNFRFRLSNRWKIRFDDAKIGTGLFA